MGDISLEREEKKNSKRHVPIYLVACTLLTGFPEKSVAENEVVLRCKSNLADDSVAEYILSADRKTVELENNWVVPVIVDNPRGLVAATVETDVRDFVRTAQFFLNKDTGGYLWFMSLHSCGGSGDCDDPEIAGIYDTGVCKPLVE
jgi:hypothetical protein